MASQLVQQLATTTILALLCTSINGQTVRNDCPKVLHLHYVANASNYQYVRFNYKSLCINCPKSDNYEILTVELPAHLHDVVPYWNNQAKHILLEIPASSYFTSDTPEPHDLMTNVSYKCKEHSNSNTISITINLKPLSIELYVNSSYSKTLHQCQSMELECIVSGLFEKDDNKVVDNIHIDVHQDKGVDSDKNMTCALNKSKLMCRRTISPCDQTNSGIYSCTVKIDGKNFSSLVQDVQVDSNEIELIIILASSICGMFVIITIAALILINITSFIYIKYKGRNQRPPAVPPPLLPPPREQTPPQAQPVRPAQPSQNGQAPQRAQRPHPLGQQPPHHRRVQSPLRAQSLSPSPLRAHSPQHARQIEYEPLLRNDSRIERNQVSLNIHGYGGTANRIEESAVFEGDGQLSCGEDKGELSNSNEEEDRVSSVSMASSGRTHGSHESGPENVSLLSHRNAYETQV